MALTKITKIGSNGLDDDVSAGGGGGLNITDTVSKLLFIHHGGFESDATIGAPQKFSEIFTHADATVDIESGVTVTVDEDSILILTPKTSFDMNFMANGASGTNLQRRTKFDDNVRTVVDSNITLGGVIRVGYSQIPTYLETDLPFDIENNVTVTVDDGALLVI